MIFRTESGSIYEMDQENMRIRRLNGEADPTPRQGKDGEWRTYASLFPNPPTEGTNLVIYWPPKTVALLEGSPQNASPATITSKIVKINPEQS